MSKDPHIEGDLHAPDSGRRRMDDLLRYLDQAKRGPRKLVESEIRERTAGAWKGAAISRVRTRQDRRVDLGDAGFDAALTQLYEVLKAHFDSEPAGERPQDQSIPGLELRTSPVFPGIRRALGLREEKLRFMRADLPGDYLAIAFSSSWHDAFTISVVRIGKVDEQLVSSELQSNKGTTNVEVYRGVVYGRSETRGIIGFEERQGFIRHYVQRERSPRVGAMLWMKGFMMTSTGDQDAFFSPFFMERIPTGKNGRFWEQDVFDEDPSRGATAFAVDNFCRVEWVDGIAQIQRRLLERLPVGQELGPDQVSGLAFFRRFLRHADAHFNEAKQKIDASLGRMAPQSLLRLDDDMARRLNEVGLYITDAAPKAL
jgi:hypothetical protein